MGLPSAPRPRAARALRVMETRDGRTSEKEFMGGTMGMICSVPSEVVMIMEERVISVI